AVGPAVAPELHGLPRCGCAWTRAAVGSDAPDDVGVLGERAPHHLAHTPRALRGADRLGAALVVVVVGALGIAASELGGSDRLLERAGRAGGRRGPDDVRVRAPA